MVDPEINSGWRYDLATSCWTWFSIWRCWKHERGR